MMKYTVRIGDSKRNLGEADWRNLDLIQTEVGWHLVHDDVSYAVEVVQCNVDTGIVSLRIDGEFFEISINDEVEERISDLGLGRRVDERPDFLAAPMPGLVLEVLVETGQKVEQDEPLLVLQAMKMENLLKAAFPITVGDVLISAQQKVEKGEKLILFESYE